MNWPINGGERFCRSRRDSGFTLKAFREGERGASDDVP